MRWLKILLITFSVIALLLFCAVELSSPWVNSYRSKIEQYASELVGKPIKITKVETGWYYFEPVIRLIGISIEDNRTHTIVVIKRVGLGINWLSSLWHWKLEPGILVASQVKVRVDASWSKLSQPTSLSSGQLQEIFPAIVSFEKIILTDLSIWWKNDTGVGLPSFKVSNAFIRLKRKIAGYYLKTELDWQNRLGSQQKPTHVFAGINFSADFFNHMTQEGSFFVEAQNVNFRETQERILAVWKNDALSSVTFARGRGDIQFHGNLKKNTDTWSILQWSFLTHFNNVTWNALSGSAFPSVKGLSGSLFMEPEEGTLRINTQSLRINYPALFSHVLPFSNANINLQWHKSGSQWSMSTEKFEIENQQISANAEGNLQWKEGISDAVIQLNMPFTLSHLPEIRQYLPDNVMKPKLRAWLHRSIVGGTTTTGNMMLKGKLSEFPFDSPNKSNGLFLIDSNFQRLTLDFKEGWPVGKLMNAHIIFRNRDLIAEIRDGTIDQLPLNNVNAQILGLGLGKETLQIEGHLEADTAKARNFVLNSPLIEHLGAFKNMDLSGPGVFDIDIQIPLYPENDINLVKGKARFLDSTLILKKWWNLTFEHFKGDLTYNQDGVIDSNLTASLFNYPLQLTMKSVKKPIPATLVDVKGQLGIEALHQIFPVFIFDFMKGVTSYTSQLILTTSKKVTDKLILKSNLEGISIDLPIPFGKKTAEKSPLSLMLEFSDDESAQTDTRLYIDFNRFLSLYLGYQTLYEGQAKEYKLHQAKVSLGGKKAQKPQGEGVVIEGSLPEFSLNAWEPFFQAMSGKKENQKTSVKSPKPIKKIKPAKKESGTIIQSVQFSTPRLITNYQTFHNTMLLLSPENNLWKLNIKSDEIFGDVQISTPLSSGITARLNYIHLNEINLMDNKPENSLASPLAPLDIPPLNLQVSDFRYQKMNLGSVSLITTRDTKNNALIVKKLLFNAPASKASFQGVWKQDKAQSMTQIRGTLASTSVQQTLKDLDIAPVIQGTGELNVDLHWLDSPTKFSAAMLNGSVSLLLKKGVITHLTPSVQDKVGLGKLLSIFSLQTLAQHLTLDFSDLSAKGLSFDVLKGNFVLKQGRMFTNDTALQGPIADITMTGAIDMGKKLYDLIVNITPSDSSTIPVIATIAGGPVLGLAALAATTIIHQGIKETSMYRYKVSGPWKKPTVKTY
jgi:uncharacterized protein (TIGR02099 family)